jgi:hypothetical protein
MDNSRRKCFIFACLVGIFYYGSAVAATLNETVDGPETSAQEWQIDNSVANKVTFSDQDGERKGSIAVTGADSGATAASVVFDRSVESEQKKASKLTLEFANGASVGTELDDPANLDNKINAHIHAANTTVGQSAVGINLGAGVNLKIVGTDSHRPVLVAHSNATNGSSAAIAIRAMNTNSIEIGSQTSLTAYDSVSTIFSSVQYYSASTVVGAASVFDNSTARSLDIQFGDDNILIATSHTSHTDSPFYAANSSASTGVGATSARENGSASMSSSNVRFENNNTLTASSFASSFANFSASTGVGTTTTHGDSMVHNLDVQFGNGNILRTYCSSATSSASTGVGATAAVATVAGNSTADTLKVRFGDDNILIATFSPSSPTSNGNSASTGVGATAAADNSTARSLDVQFGNGNRLSATAVAADRSHRSASTGVGATSAYGNTINTAATAATADTLNVRFGNDNTLTASSSAQYYSASTGIGATAAYDYKGSGDLMNMAATANALDIWFGNSNNLNVSSVATANSDGCFSASTGVGATSAFGSTTGAMVTANALKVRFGNGNSLSVSSYSPSSANSPSASTGMGATATYKYNYKDPSTTDTAATANALDIGFGDGNNLIISSFSSTNHSVSTGVGVATGRGNGVASGLNVRFGNGNSLTVVAATNSSAHYSASTGVGAATARGTNSSTANAVTVNINGTQNLSALAYAPNAANTRVNVFGADNTDPGDFGWRVGIFATGQDIRDGEEVIAKALTGNSIVNIFATKLSDKSIGNGVATFTLGADQGTDHDTYARAFALGRDYQIYFGGKANSNTHLFEAVVPPDGKTNEAYIMGAIGKGIGSTDTTGSSLTVDQGWTVHAFGPVEDLGEITVRNNGSLKTYGSLCNDVISEGEVTVYGQTNGIGTIELKGGILHLSTDATAGTKFNGAIQSIAGKMTYVDPTTGTSYEGSDGKIRIDATAYPWKGGSGTGRLALTGGDVLKFHVDSSQLDTTTAIELTNPDDNFEIAKGYVSIDAGTADAIKFSDGKLGIVDDSTSSPGILPAHADFWLIRMGANADIKAVAAAVGFNLSDGEKFSKVNDNLYKLTPAYENMVFSKVIDAYAEWEDALDVWLFNDETNKNSGLFVGTGETPFHAVASEYTKQHVNGEVSSLTMTANTLVSNAVSDRLTSVKGCLSDPFIHAIYGRAHQNEMAGFGYNNSMGGLVLGLDDVWNFPDEKYLRLGTILGYIHGKTNFFGSATGLGKSAKQDFYTVELFGAYESFNDKLLKTNLGIFFGYSYSSDRLRRMDANFSVFNGKIRSHSIFMTIELVKNLYAYKGCQFGLWLRANYNHIAQKGYDETTTATVGAQHVSAVNHDLITTLVGLNVEKEILDPEHADKKWLLSLKAGWECQAVQKISDATVTFDNNFGIGEITPIFRYPSKHVAIGTLSVSRKFNANWSVVGSYAGRFNKDTSTHTLSCGVEYSF